MTPLEALRALQTRSLVTIDEGAPCKAELYPVLSRDEIEEIEERIGRPLPPEVRELMSVTAGVIVDTEEVCWNGEILGQIVPEEHAFSMPVMEDGRGNSWNVDIDPDTGAWGPVYFVCHDPPVVVKQADSLAEFLIQFADDSCQPEREGSLYMVSERYVNKVWDTSGAAVDAESLRVSTDAVLRQAAQHVQDGIVCDLRRAKMGDGFAWGRYGPRAIIKRPGRDPVWTVQKPEGSKKWWKLWG